MGSDGDSGVGGRRDDDDAPVMQKAVVRRVERKETAAVTMCLY